jgi:hypothetical protein
MERRDFLASAISSVLAAAGLGTAAATDDDCQPEMHGGETVAPSACECCQKLHEYNQKVRTELVPNTEYERQKIKRAVDPENHSWEGDCLYTEATPIVNDHAHEDHQFTKEDVREMDYDIKVSHTASIVDVTVTINPPMPLRVIESTVTVGDVDG